LQLVDRTPAPIDRTAENMLALNQFALDGDTVYFYGTAGGYQCEGFSAGGPFAPGRYVARAAASTPMDWEYWTGTGWSGEVTDATPMVVADGSPLPGLNVTKYGSGFLGTGRLGLTGFFTPQVLAYYSAAPSGPWHPLGEIVPAEPTLAGARVYYGGHVRMNVPGTSQDEPMVVFSTNGAGGTDGQTGSNALLYGPQFVRPTGLPSADELAARFPLDPEEPPTTTTTTTTTTETTTPETTAPETTTTEPETTTTEPEPTTTTDTTVPETTTTTDTTVPETTVPETTVPETTVPETTGAETTTTTETTTPETTTPDTTAPDDEPEGPVEQVAELVQSLFS
jgi:hypothetical protein